MHSTGVPLLQGGNLISLKPRGSAVGSSSTHAGGEWEQWPDEAGSSGQGNEDDELQRAIAASLADPDQGVANTA